jgi:hypothetical protein
MTLNFTTAPKCGAIALAIILAALWMGAMLWRIGPIGRVEALAFAFCCAAGSFGWYQAIRFGFSRYGLLPPERDETAEARRGRVYPWIVFVVAMVVTRQMTAWLLDLVNPLMPAEDWHHLTTALFIIYVWPGLMWSLRPLIRRHLPPPKKRASGSQP